MDAVLELGKKVEKKGDHTWEEIPGKVEVEVMA